MRRQPVQRGRHRRTLVPALIGRKRWRKVAFATFLAAALLLPAWWTAQTTSANRGALIVMSDAPASTATDPLAAKSPALAPPVPSEPSEGPNQEGGLKDGSPPLHITYGAVGLDQNVVPLAPTAEELRLGAIVPPHTSDAYWLSPYGMPGGGSTNTTYIVGHSLEGRPSPFNNISEHAKPGDLLTVTTAEGHLGYRIDAVTTEYKDTLKDSAIWDKQPGRLMVITCYTADLWGKNIIVQASPLPPQ